MICRYVISSLAIVCVASLFIVTQNTGAQQSTLEQRINPYLCVYTNVQTGETAESTDTTCHERPIPTVEKINGITNRPIITGYFNTAQTKILRIELNDQQYTSGVDDVLDTQSGVNIWKLDLSDLKTPLAPGAYILWVEAETYDGYLLRNNQAFILEVPKTQTQPTTGMTVFDRSRVYLNEMIFRIFSFEKNNPTPQEGIHQSPPVDRVAPSKNTNQTNEVIALATFIAMGSIVAGILGVRYIKRARR